MLPKIDAPEEETPGKEPESVEMIIDTRTQEQKDQDLLFDTQIRVKN